MGHLIDKWWKLADDEWFINEPGQQEEGVTCVRNGTCN